MLRVLRLPSTPCRPRISAVCSVRTLRLTSVDSLHRTHPSTPVIILTLSSQMSGHLQHHTSTDGRTGFGSSCWYNCRSSRVGRMGSRRSYGVACVCCKPPKLWVGMALIQYQLDCPDFMAVPNREIAGIGLLLRCLKVARTCCTSNTTLIPTGDARENTC